MAESGAEIEGRDENWEAASCSDRHCQRTVVNVCMWDNMHMNECLYTHTCTQCKWLCTLFSAGHMTSDQSAACIKSRTYCALTCVQ